MEETKRLISLMQDIGVVATERLTGTAAMFDVQPDDVFRAAKPIPKRISGIYFFVSNGEIVYVGQSKHVWSRIDAHKNAAWYSLETDLQVCLLPIEDNIDELDVVEAFYIQKFKPSGNRNKHGRLNPHQLEDAVIRVISRSVQSEEMREFIHLSLQYPGLTTKEDSA